MNKKIEFVYQSGRDFYNPNILIMDLNDISFISGLNPYMTYLETKNGKGFNLFGKLRTISNRITNVESVDNNVYDNLSIRPSLNLKYKYHFFQIDNITMDTSQLKAFLDAFFFNENDPQDKTLEEIYKSLNEHSSECIMKIDENFWKYPLISGINCK